MPNYLPIHDRLPIDTKIINKKENRKNIIYHLLRGSRYIAIILGTHANRSFSVSSH